MKFTENIKVQYIISCFLFLAVALGCTETAIDPPPPDVEAIFERPVKEIPFEELLDEVQQRTFNYFWDFAEPISGLARERSQEEALDGESKRVITMGGSGFGLSAFPIAVERGWQTKTKVIERLQKVLTFLEGAEKYHGAFSHWYFGDTGITRPFSAQDDGGDLVETAFLIQGLLINREYFSGNNDDEKDIRDRITAIWEGVEWDWYARNEKIITWHWSKTHEFAINLKVRGWNEGLIVYVLAASSPTHSIDKETYINGWASNGAMKNGNTYFDIKLPLGPQKGGPLFFSQYSFIGLNPTNLTDQFANYFEQNRAHSLINYNHCKENPNGYKGYGGDSWGLTASDDFNGYAVHEPENDIGVITPTAALSAFPYTPVESKKAIEYFYYKQNAKLWGDYGFYDAFSETNSWYSDGYLAIDQGPIVCMIENYRTQLLWNLFMQNQEIKDGLTKLGFTY
ncbi:beta-glucosidase [Polaribacter haliotis]|uniref:Beta-glucosidase n=2 Tax=Polaribacter TaxID=52959 RepID=A0A7L8AGA2_9FLAO|nr:MULTISPECIES: glucoamylase family protein [Polaribacter]MDD7914128.1 glucoamylase family protein [Polaribacter sp. MSW5]QOD60997.1 beta-glucosidase [Polaribacter haliotis]